MPICRAHDYDIEHSPCPECEIEASKEEQEEKPTRILIKEALGKQLKILDGLVEKCKMEKRYLVAGYLSALDQTNHDVVEISSDYTFLTLIKKKEKNDGQDGN